MSKEHIVGFILGLSAGVVLGACLELREQTIVRAGNPADAAPEKPPADLRPQRVVPAVA
jgi:hypothetical protein